VSLEIEVEGPFLMRTTVRFVRGEMARRGARVLFIYSSVVILERVWKVRRSSQGRDDE
jgi:hypothetical protein